MALFSKLIRINNVHFNILQRPRWCKYQFSNSITNCFLFSAIARRSLLSLFLTLTTRKPSSNNRTRTNSRNRLHCVCVCRTSSIRKSKHAHKHTHTHGGGGGFLQAIVHARALFNGIPIFSGPARRPSAPHIYIMRACTVYIFKRIT